MTNVAQLVPRSSQIKQETVDLLEKYLAMAREGRIASVAIAGLDPSGGAFHEATSSQQQVTMLGAVSRLWHCMQMLADEHACEPPAPDVRPEG